MEVVFNNGKRYNASSTRYDWYYSIYLKNFILRPSCYECKYATKIRNADVSIADFWNSKMVCEKAQSLIIINTELGLSWIPIETMEVDEIEESQIHQPHMQAPCKKPDAYEKFWNIYLNKGYSAVQKWIGNNTLVAKVKVKIISGANFLGILKVVKRILAVLQ